jgi:hypothetical protein
MVDRRCGHRAGVGSDSAAALLITAGDNWQRLHSEAAVFVIAALRALHNDTRLGLPRPASSQGAAHPTNPS